ncbi:uncharacterized protein ACRADG_012865 [Cochliomyia hominivorax]
MSSYSKFFQEHITPKSCQEFGLHLTSCKEHLAKDILLYSISNFKYFIPICLLPILINIRSINKEKIQNTLENYLGCSLMGSICGYSINLLMCSLRNILGRFGYYSFVFIPTFLGGCLVHLGPERVANLFETTILQCGIENLLIMRKNFLTRSIANSKLLQTGLFMICSCIILHAKQLYNAKGFWLLVPNPQILYKENSEEYLYECELHPDDTCNEYLFKGMRKYFIMGLSLDILKMLMSPVGSAKSQLSFLNKLNNFRARSTTLLTLYIGIYRFVHCWLNGKSYCSDSGNHMLSSFLAGSCFYFYPQSTLFSFGLVQAARSLWRIFEVKNIDNQNKIIKRLLQIPFGRILYPFVLANMVHLVALHPMYASRLSTTIANNIANNYPNHVSSQINLLKTKYNFSGTI